ncbi:methyl-accepting chemotaxis protein [Vibrio porteresiae]|uniref:Methyl-accepting chemotaxis protein n=1 Tax=Vibrio porteresiae DSM 19223 TaxID=1123496 RepID=A0ABZ0QCZ3_9VIBR|nr:methyl-accepting chemotaxis protein [Vibrio porteresiae]WPC73398.1 methyl-accepting chemotaxis protein [Vibrio porteresiae DSM 19223]
MMLPIILLAVLVLAIFVFMQVITKIEARAMEKQTKSYFEAIAVVLNADRDIYQARLAQAEMLSNFGDKVQQLQDFHENAQQVYDRFQRYRKYLVDEPELVRPFSNFDQLYDDWLQSSKNVSSVYTANKAINERLTAIDKDFFTLRSLLDQAEAKLRVHASSRSSEDTDRQQLKRYLDALAEVLNADRDLYQARLAQQKLLTGIGDIAKNRSEFEENALQAINRFQSYRTLMSPEPDFVSPYAQFDHLFAGWFKESSALMDSNELKTSVSQNDILTATDEKFERIRDLLDSAGEAVKAYGLLMEQKTVEEIKGYQQAAIIIVIIGFIIAFLIGYYMPKRITQNVNNISQRIREISQGDGDLTARINSKAKDELGDLAHEFDAFVGNLQAIMKVIQSKSAALGDSTHQLEAVANSVSNITQRLVESSDSIVSAASEMSMANEQMADVASNTSDESTKAADHIDRGRGVVRSSHASIDSLVDNIDITMTKAEELEKNSEAISSVLEVIRGIAEQTNLLALNAAIEAARAGEFGRGFAVVADEVRKLATQTGESTNQIEQMISQLTASVSDAFAAIKLSKNNATSAVSNFDNVIQVFDALNSSFNSVRDLSEQTALATQEQSSVSNEINKNLISMKDQTDGVDRASKEIRQQFNHLNNVYLELNGQVSKFRV